MAKFNKQTTGLIDRLAALNYDEPYFNLEKVSANMARHYELLGVKMPEIVVADNMLIGFELAYGEVKRGAAWDAAWGAAWDAAWGAARDAAWDAAWGAARVTAATAALPDDPRVIKYVEIDIQIFQALENGLGFFFPMRDKLILVPVPRMITLNNRLHYDHGKAVEWSDGTGFYFLRGVKFEQELYERIISQEMTAEEVLTIRDSDQRAAAISMLHPKELLKQMNAKLVHTGIKGTQLYEVKNFMGTGKTQYCMFMVDASTPREFVEWVEPKVGKSHDADLCQANAWGITREQYLSIEQEG